MRNGKRLMEILMKMMKNRVERIEDELDFGLIGLYKTLMYKEN